MNSYILSKTLNVFKNLLIAHIFFLFVMSLFRVVFFIYYSPLESLDGFYLDLLNAFFLGVRIDLTVVGYIQIIPTLILIFIYYLKKESILYFFNNFFVYYLLFCYIVVSLLICADFGFYSYFKEHINILFFGLMDDDTKALIITMWENYNVVLILTLFLLYIYFLYKIVKFIFSPSYKNTKSFFGLKVSFVIFTIFFILNF